MRYVQAACSEHVSGLPCLTPPPALLHLQVSQLIYCNELKVVVSCSWDRSIVVHDEMDPEKGVVRLTPACVAVACTV